MCARHVPDIANDGEALGSGRKRCLSTPGGDETSEQKDSEHREYGVEYSEWGGHASDLGGERNVVSLKLWKYPHLSIIYKYFKNVPNLCCTASDHQNVR